MSRTCNEFCHHQKHRHLREAIPTGDIRGMTDADLRSILRMRRVTIPKGADRAKLIRLIRKSEKDDVGGYYGRYWRSPPGIQMRTSQLSSNFTYRVVNRAMDLTAQRTEAKWILWVTSDDDRVCPICEPRHLVLYSPGSVPTYPAHAGCRCQLDVIYTEEI